MKKQEREDKKVIDITQMPEILDVVNKALNDKRIVEIKNEGYNDVNIVVVCVDRKVLTKSKEKSKVGARVTD